MLKNGPLRSLQMTLCGPYKWLYKWVAGVISPMGGILTLMITGLVGPCLVVEWVPFAPFISLIPAWDDCPEGWLLGGGGACLEKSEFVSGWFWSVVGLASEMVCQNTT